VTLILDNNWDSKHVFSCR